MTWVSVEEVAQLLNKSVGEFSPEAFKQVYEDVWIKQHRVEAAEDNPDPDAELEDIEQAMNETGSSDEPMAPTPPAIAEDEGTTDDASDPIEDDSSSGRKLASSVAARFVSAALRIFGI